MRFNNLDLNLLVALDLLLVERNVSRAAEKMHITQSAMSNALARLRDYFGDDLLVLVGRGMELTPRAELLRAPVRDILVRIEASVTAAPAFDPRNSDRTFKICVSDYTLTILVPRFLRMIAGQGYSIGFDFMPQSNQPDQTLERGEADILIIPENYASPGHPKEILYVENFVCIADVKHPRVGDTISIDAFRDERHAVVRPASGAQSFESISMTKLGIERLIDTSTFSFMSLPYLVAGTERIATAHARLAREATQHLPLKIVDLPFDVVPMQEAMQWHSYRTKDPALIWLKNNLRTAAELLDSAEVMPV